MGFKCHIFPLMLCTQVSVLIRSHFFIGIVFKFRIRAPATLAKKSNLHLAQLLQLGG